MIPVTVVTANAAADDLTDADYADIYQELRQEHSLDAFVALLRSAYSKGTWSRYEHGQWALTRDARNELRHAVGLSLLPVTVGEAVAVVDPDATVYRVGSGAVDRVVLVAQPGPIVMRLNGTLEASEAASRGWIVIQLSNQMWADDPARCLELVGRAMAKEKPPAD